MTRFHLPPIVGALLVSCGTAGTAPLGEDAGANDAGTSDAASARDASTEEAVADAPIEASAPTPRCGASGEGGHAPGAPVVFHAPRSARPGDIVYLQGAHLGNAVVTLGGTTTVLPAMSTYADAFVTVRVPDTASEPLYLCVSNHAGAADPVMLDQALPYNLDTTEIVPGAQFRVLGKNLLVASQPPTVLVDGRPAAIDLARSTPTLLVASAPAGVAPGPATITVDSGNGAGSAQLGQPGVAVVATGSTADPFDLGIAWASTFAAIASVTVDATSDPHVSPHMVAGDSTDDTAALQAAVDYAHSIGGATVAIPAGTYRVAGSVTMRSNVVLRGAGKTATVLDYVDTTFPNYPIYSNKNDRVGLVDLTLSTSVGNQPVLWTNGTHSFFKRIALVENVSSNWLASSGNVDFAVEDSDFTATALGVSGQGVQYAGFSSGLVMTGNTYTYAGGVALDLTGVTDGFVAGNTFTWDASLQKSIWMAGGSKPGDAPAATHAIPLPSTKRLTLDSNRFQIANGPVMESWAWNDGEAIYAEDGDTMRTAHVGKVTSAGASTLTDTSATLAFTNPSGLTQLAGPSHYVVAILSGTGFGQLRHIASYAQQTITVEAPWDVVPDATSVYLTVVPAWEDIVISHNALQGWPRGTWSYILTASQVDIVDNTYTEGGGVYLRAQSGASTEPQYAQNGGLDTAVVMDVNVAGNTVTNATGNWNSYFAALYDTVDTSPAGLGFVGVVFRHNTLVANNPNVETDHTDLTGFEGYANFLHYEGSGTYAAPAVPTGLGTIFQGNACTNCPYPFRTGTGDYATVYAQTMLADSGSGPLVTQYFVPSGAVGSQGDVVEP